MTQVELAGRLDVQPNTVARWENGVMVVPKMVDLALKAIEAESTPKK